MRIDDGLVKDVLDHADIVKIISSYLNVTKKGRNYWAICPFHDDTNPSLSISPEKKIFRCFVCGTSGSAISFVQKYEHISFADALRKVAEMSDYHDPRLDDFKKAVKPVDDKRETLLKCLSDLTLYYQFALNTEEGAVGLDYFESRHLDDKMRSKYRLGYAFKDGKATCEFLQKKGHSMKTIEDVGIALINNNALSDKNAGRAIFPICDIDGHVIGFSARRIGDGPEAKYVNSPETYLFHKSNVLYNYHIAKEKAHIAEYVYVCEGFMDVFALSRIGIDSAVAIMGTALTKEHIELLRRLNVEIRLCLDGDLPGQTAMMTASKQLSEAGLNVRIVNNQNSPKDPDEILNQDGEDALRVYLNNLLTRIDFALNYFKNTNPLKTMDQKKKLVQQFIPILIGINSQLELDTYLRKLAGVTGFEVESIRDLVTEAKQNERYGKTIDVIKEFHPERKALRRLQLAERELLYQMINNSEAVSFYEEKVGTFYDEVYRQVANYVIDYMKVNKGVSPIGILASLEMSDIDNKQELINELTEISYENTHSNNFSQELLDNLYTSIMNEKERIFEKDTLEQSIEGKDPLEKARIMAEYNRRKMRKINAENEKDQGGK